MDSWCRKVRAKNGNVVSGGAARNVRIASGGGMDNIVEQVARDAARRALELVDAEAHQRNMRPKLRLVA
jgi:hypothetical protein